MNKTVVFATIAMFGYATGNLLLEQKLSKFNNLTLIFCYCVVIGFAALVGRQLTNTGEASYAFPIGWDLLTVIALGLIFFAAEYFFIGAYTNGGDLFNISIIVAMFPVFASIMKFGLTHQLPNFWQIGGYVLALLAVMSVVRGGMQN